VLRRPLVDVERDGEVEWPARSQTSTGRNDARAPFPPGHADRTLVRMGRKKLDYPGRRGRTQQQLVYGFDRRDLLDVAIAAGVVVRPGNRGRLHIVTHVSRFVELAVLNLKEMCGTHASQVAHRRSNILMISGYQ